MSAELRWSEADAAHMRHALDLAALALNNTDPNPRVGCVLVKEQRVVGEGWHERAGLPHAEANALAAAGEAARDATAYVTLEPCATQGRVAPCAQVLHAAGVSRVVYAAADPNPRKGGGAALLRTLGVEVRGGLLAGEARALNPGFHKRHEQGLPWVRLKFGLSLDGRIALASGESRWITGSAARLDAQKFRARSSVIMTGIGTLLADDPALNVRIEGVSRQPLRVVLDSALRAPPGARTFAREGASLVLYCAAPAERVEALRASGAAVEQIAADADGHVDLRAALRRLAALEANEVWVEAGAQLGGALLDAGLVDELVLYYAGTLLGNEARGMAGIAPLASLAARQRWRFTDVTLVGEDLRVCLQPLAAAGGGNATAAGAKH